MLIIIIMIMVDIWVCDFVFCVGWIVFMVLFVGEIGDWIWSKFFYDIECLEIY